MSVGSMNLARRPFLNRRPVWRFAAFASLVGVALLATNVLLFVRYRRDSTDLRLRLSQTRSEVETVSRSIVELSGGLERMGLEAQNEKIDYLNSRLAERGFPWSQLFQRIGETLPLGVRLTSLSPRLSFGSRRTSAASTRREQQLALNVDGVARSSEELYAFVDALFAHEAFSDPLLHNESIAEDGEVSFRLDIQLHPEALGPKTPAAEAAGEAGL